MKVVMSVFESNFKWLPWKFARVPGILGEFQVKVTDSYWKEDSNVRQFLDHLTKELGIVHLDDWYGVSVQEVKDMGGRFALSKIA